MAKSKKVNFTRRTNGEGSVYQIKDGRYGAAISLGKDATGKRLRHVETGKTEQEAMDKMNLWLAKNGHLSQETVVINGQSTVEEFVENFRSLPLPDMAPVLCRRVGAGSTGCCALPAALERSGSL